MIDAYSLATKFHLDDLERQVAASRRPQARLAEAEGAAAPDRAGRLGALIERLSARDLASAVRGLVAAVF
jgi:hypothetical protein